MANLALEKATVLGGLIYFQGVRDKYIAVVNRGERIVDDQRSAFRSVEGLISLIIRSDRLVKPEYLMRMIGQQYSQLSPSDMEMRRAYAELFEQLDQREMFTEGVCSKLLEEVIQAKAIRELQTQIAQPKTRTVAALQAAYATFSSTIDSIKKDPGNSIRVWHPLKDMKELLVEKPRTPTGVAIIDKILAGGIAVGEHTGILGPSGGGKTILANMLQCNLAIRRFNTLLIQTEQPISGDIAVRMYSYMLGLPKSTFMGKDYKDIDPAIIKRIEELQPVWDRMRCISTADKVARTSKATKEVIDMIEKEVMDTGFKPSFIILDWLGKLVTQFMRCSSSSEQAFCDRAEELKADLNAFGRAHDISIIYLHQTDTLTQHREPAYKPTKNDADHYHAFANDLEACVCLGTATKFDDGLQVAWLGADKARNMQSGRYVMAKVDGAHVRITECEDGEYALNSKGQFQPMRELIGVTTKSAARMGAVYVPPEGSSDAYMTENY